jgi:hypothetical protein
MSVRGVVGFLYRSYIEPVRRDLLAQFLLGLLFASSVLLWASSGFQMRVPPFEMLNRTSGVLDFSKDPLRRGGDYTVIKTPDGAALTFSCEGGGKSDRDCLLRKEQAQWRGRPATVWWFPSKTSGGGEWRSLAQLEVEGKVVLSFLVQKRTYEETNVVYLVSLGLVVLGAACYLLFLPLRASLQTPSLSGSTYR